MGPVNIMRGIAAYSNPWSEMQLRMHILNHVKWSSERDRVDIIADYVKRFGRESVRAVAGEDGA